MGQGFESLLAHRVGVAQLVEHWVVVPGVEGSSPFTHLVSFTPEHDILLMSVKYLDRYVNELAGRHNTRPLDTLVQIEHIAQGLVEKNLKYRELVV